MNKKKTSKIIMRNNKTIIENLIYKGPYGYHMQEKKIMKNVQVITP